MEYSVKQINNLLRTYPRHLKVRPTLRDQETQARMTRAVWTMSALHQRGDVGWQKPRPRTPPRDHSTRLERVHTVF